MKSVMQSIRFPEDFDKAVDKLIETSGKTRTQLVRAALIMTWRDHFESYFGEQRMSELVAEYHKQEKAKPLTIGPDGREVPESEQI